MPKLWGCQHTCCWVCLTQMKTTGFTVTQLLNDPAVIAVVCLPHDFEGTPVFFHLPGSSCYVLLLGNTVESRATVPGDTGTGRQKKAVTEEKSRAWEEFGEAMENDYWSASKRFWQTIQLRRGWMSFAQAVLSKGGEILTSNGDIVRR
uniref:E3 ubiquitin-protein ligase RNF152 C-terminal domain-containing protein n=1 Tax=Scleropages formosus TaxID=113540 RepID=A0A8C9RY14_SCLFO